MLCTRIVSFSSFVCVCLCVSVSLVVLLFSHLGRGITLWDREWGNLGLSSRVLRWVSLHFRENAEYNDHHFTLLFFSFWCFSTTTDQLNLRAVF